MNLYAVIMAGGSGTRFWPLSRKRYPKQLLNLSQKRSLLQDTVERIKPLIPYERIIIVTTRKQAEALGSQVPNIPKENILTEAVGRNTSAAIALAAIYLKSVAPNAVMAVLPADQIIKKAQTFRSLLKCAVGLAKHKKHLITIGIQPNCPHTGYGYIIYNERIESETGGKGEDFPCYRVESYIEKPGLEKAERLLAEGRSLWNGGMFVWHVDTCLEALSKYLPDLYQPMQVLEKTWDAKLAESLYPQLPSISIDYGVMERADNVAVFPASIGWNDMGSWESLGEIYPCDEFNNISPGQLLNLDSRDLTVYSPDKLVAALGVKDLIIVNTADVLLVCHKDRAQDIRKMVEAVKEKGWEEYL
ncbi:MAG: mannose-1-phosphate guanylyltransferase [Candidatus Schekmanbacteria bacterium]|nr:mannose-1-phosphate guanylyltransferase [Candidatus Schekmanbacteria bacterium]